MLPNLHEKNSQIAFVDLLFNTVGHTAMHQQQKLFYTFALAENDEVFNWYKEIGWNSSECRKVPSGVDIKLFNEKKPLNLMTQYGISQEDIVIGCSGRLSPEKDPIAFVEIARLCEGIKNLHFIMTGDGPMEGEVRKAVQQLPPSIRFSYIGVVDDVAPFFSLYDVAIIPSIIDGRPLAALEALASGAAVIASRVGGLPELIFDGFNGYLCEPGKPADFASRITMLIKSKIELSRLKKNARDFAEKNLDSTKSFTMYEKALLEAINSKLV
jgi:glycosyltransferase involved in cell wall biosynthesis